MKSGRVLIALALVAAAGRAHAQPVPGPANPERVPERFQPPPAPKSTAPVTVPAPNILVPPEQAAATHFVLKSVVFDGATVFKPADFASLYSSLLGKDVTLLDIYRLRDAVTTKYRAAGYILSQAIIPPQQIGDGIAHIRVIEGYISGISVEGASDRRGLIRATAAKISAERPLNVRTLERYVLLIGDLPGVTVNTVLKPSADQPGAAELVVVVNRKSFQGSLSADNRGSIAIGPEEFTVGLEVNSILGLDEQTGVEYATTAQTRELQYLSIHHDEVLNAEGLRLSFSGSESWSHPGGTLSVLNPFGRGDTWRLHLAEPVIRSRARSLTLGLGLNAQDSRTDLLSVTVAKDRVRFFSFDLAFDFADTALGDARPAQSLIRAELSQGFNGLGATPSGSPNLSRANGRSDFTKLNLDALRIQSVAPRVSVALGAQVQLTNDSLLSSQQCGLGGSRFGRGYEPSELTGDVCGALSIEGRYTLPLKADFIQTPQLYAFWEGGIASLNHPLLGEPQRQSLASAGVGFRFKLAHRITAEFELAKPLTRPIASRGNKNLRPLFAVSTQF